MGALLDKWAKKTGNKAAVGAIETAKETLNDKLESYSGIIKIGLTLGIIIFGTNKITQHTRGAPQQTPYSQQPIIINNYITERRTSPYGNGKQNSQKHQNRR